MSTPSNRCPPHYRWLTDRGLQIIVEDSVRKTEMPECEVFLPNTPKAMTVCREVSCHVSTVGSRKPLSAHLCWACVFVVLLPVGPPTDLSGRYAVVGANLSSSLQSSWQEFWLFFAFFAAAAIQKSELGSDLESEPVLIPARGSKEGLVFNA